MNFKIASTGFTSHNGETRSWEGQYDNVSNKGYLQRKENDEVIYEKPLTQKNWTDLLKEQVKPSTPSHVSLRRRVKDDFEHKRPSTSTTKATTTITKDELQDMARKYEIPISGTKKEIAERLSDSRGEYLSKTEIKHIVPLLPNDKHTRGLQSDNRTRKRFYSSSSSSSSKK
tara:strand:+ start:958 stop:1473 length:516 start_codon:yes stop_codon:yes gene_type:complete